MAKEGMIKHWLILGLLALLAAVVFVVDLRLLPDIYMPAVAYMVPVLLSAYLIPRPRWVAGIALWTLALQIAAYLLEGKGMTLLPVSYIAGLSLVSLLCVVLSSRAEREAELRVRLSAVLEQMPAGVIIAEAPSGRLTLSNPQVERVWHHPFIASASVDEYEAWKGFHPDGRPYAPEEWPLARSIVSGEVVTDEEVRIPWEDGTLGTISINSAPIRDPEGRVVAGVVVMADVTERRAAEAERERLLAEVQHRAAELDAANKELESFSYSVSHDLRAPLRTIDGFSQALLEDYADSLDEVGKDYLQRVRAGSQRMGKLIDDMLTLSRVTRGEMHRERVDLSDLAEAVAAELREREPERRVELGIQSGLVVEGDTRLLKVVMENLLGNAWKFTAKRERARIEFGATKADGRTAYFVRDNGAGFDMAYADKLFGAFQRLHKESEFPGTGVGLATVLRIVRRHGGRIWAEGKVDEGATFFFTLPRAD